MRINNLIFILFITQITLVNAQNNQDISKIKPDDYLKLQGYEDSLAYYAEIMVKDTVPERMAAACDRFIPLFKEALKIDNSFFYPFDSLIHVAKLQPTDNAFRIFSWQLFKTKDEYQYFGFIQMNSKKLKLHELIDDTKNYHKVENELGTTAHWMGAIYYNLKEFKAPGVKKYLLFGYNRISYLEKRKAVEVLSFKSGKPSFGAPVFERTERNKPVKFNRLVLDYSAETDIRLNYDEELQEIVHDFLEPMPSKHPELPYVLIPDGTYEIWKLQKNGIWKNEGELPITPMKTAPRPEPVLGKKRDLFGN